MPVPSGFVANPNGQYTRGDGAGPFSFDGTTMVFAGDGPVSAYSSGNVANTAAVGTIPAAVGKRCYMTGFDISGGGANAGSIVAVTITGLLGGTAVHSVSVPGTVVSQMTPRSYIFNPPLIASADNTAITVSMAALGAGNTSACVSVYGYSI